jgi:hypothetical protein
MMLSIDTVGNVKGEYIRNILQRVQVISNGQTPVRRLIHSLKNQYHTEKSPIHDHYSTNFNYVDLADRRFYEVNETHPNQNWHRKLFLGLMRMVMINCWTHSVSTKGLSWLDFRQVLARELAEFNDK